MHRCYQTKLAPFQSKIRRRGFAEGPSWQVAVTDQASLALRVSEDGLILEARHDRASGDLELVLEAFCQLIDGMPLEEARGHGPLTLEYRLRDPEEAPPVAGLVTPENADPVFLELIELVRRFPKSDLRRPWTPPVAASWKAKPMEARKEILLASLNTELKDLGYAGPPVDLFLAPGNDRWLISFGDHHPAPPNFFMLLLSLERNVRARTGTQVELFLEGKEDRNRRQGRDIRSHDLHPSA